MKRKTDIIFSVAVVLNFTLVSCQFAEKPLDKYDEDFVFENSSKVEGYVLAVYAGLPYANSESNGYYIVGDSMLSSATDESMITNPGSSIVVLTDGSLTAGKSNPDGIWNKNYEYIRAANLGLENLHRLRRRT